MIYLTKKGFAIEVETTAPAEMMQMLTSSLLKVLIESREDYTPEHNPRPYVLEAMVPSYEQMKRALKE